MPRDPREDLDARQPLTVAAALRHAEDVLARAGVDSPAAEARWLLEAATGLRPAELALERGRPLGPAARSALAGSLARRARREPLQHIVGRTSFYGLELDVDPRALIPRPETERLVELCLDAVRDVASPRVLDVGTGGGAVALAIRSERPDARVMATDVHPEPLELAVQNARRLGLDVRFARASLLDAPVVARFATKADAIVTNPPYLPDADRAAAPPEVRHDPPSALYGGPGGAELFLALSAQARDLLRPGAWLLAELDPRNVRIARAAATGWGEARVERDLAGRERFLVLRR